MGVPMPNPLTDLPSSADSHDAVLPLLLGAFSVSRRVEAALLQASLENTDPMNPEHPLVLVALGMVSLNRTLSRWMEEASMSPALEAANTPAPLPDSRELMR